MPLAVNSNFSLRPPLNSNRFTLVGCHCLSVSLSFLDSILLSYKVSKVYSNRAWWSRRETENPPAEASSEGSVIQPEPNITTLWQQASVPSNGVLGRGEGEADSAAARRSQEGWGRSKKTGWGASKEAGWRTSQAEGGRGKTAANCTTATNRTAAANDDETATTTAATASLPLLSVNSWLPSLTPSSCSS